MSTTLEPTIMDKLQTIDSLWSWAVKNAQDNPGRVVCQSNDSHECLLAAYFVETLELNTATNGWVQVVADRAILFRPDATVEDFTMLNEEFEDVVISVDNMGSRKFTASEVLDFLKGFTKSAI